MSVEKAENIGRKAVKVINSIINLIVLTVILLLIAFALYAMWDSGQVYNAADAARYEIYKPAAVDEGKSFEELQAINPEVFAWLTVYGTHIDYPVTQGEDNMKYVNTNAEGDYSLSGSIFLDYANSKDFSDFNSIMFGHHMEKETMFGEIGLFSDKNYFDARMYGNLYYGGEDHGLQFFAFIQTDAYDHTVFSPGVMGKDAQQTYLNNLLNKAVYTRDIGVTVEDRILLLSTCSSTTTNGRDILIARITDETYDDIFKTTETNNTGTQLVVDKLLGIWERIPLWLRIVMPILLLLLLVIVIYYKHKERKQ